MAKTLDQINQDFFIECYLEGRPLQTPTRRLPPADEAEQWLQDLINDPDLEAAEDLLDAFTPTNPWAFDWEKDFQEFQEEDDEALPRPLLPGRPAEAPRERIVWSDSGAAAKQAKPKASAWKAVSNVMFYLALAAVVFSAVLFRSKSAGTQIFGHAYYEVLSGSMQSMIPKGSLVIISQVPAGEIREGSVITFQRGDGETVTHQVIEVLPDFDGEGTLGFRTKGTDNPAPDPDIAAASSVLGVVKTHVKGLGYTLHLLTGNFKCMVILFVLVILLSIALRVFLGERGAAREKGRISPQRAVAI